MDIEGGTLEVRTELRRIVSYCDRHQTMRFPGRLLFVGHKQMSALCNLSVADYHIVTDRDSTGRPIEVRRCKLIHVMTEDYLLVHTPSEEPTESTAAQVSLSHEHICAHLTVDHDKKVKHELIQEIKSRLNNSNCLEASWCAAFIEDMEPTL